MTGATSGSGPLGETIRHVAVEGVIGVGKTSLCNLLAPMLNARVVLEQAEENPFLVKFYDDRRKYAFQTQLWFLVQRYRQLSEAFLQQDLFHPVTLTDYCFAKDRIFASVNLDDDEMALYDAVAKVLSRDIPKPDLVVFLQASTEVLLKRIAKRGRPYETRMDRRYLENLAEAYNHFFFHYTEAPVLVINTSDIDFVEHPRDLDMIVEQIRHAQPGVNFVHPVSSS